MIYIVPCSAEVCITHTYLDTSASLHDLTRIQGCAYSAGIQNLYESKKMIDGDREVTQEQTEPKVVQMECEP